MVVLCMEGIAQVTEDMCGVENGNNLEELGESFRADKGSLFSGGCGGDLRYVWKRPKRRHQLGGGISASRHPGTAADGKARAGRGCGCGCAREKA